MILMKYEDVYRWYVENGEFDRDLLSKMQLECFNKRIEPAVVITGNDLNRILNSDKRFGSKYLALAFWWIFDTKYAVIDWQTLEHILNELRDVDNPWTVVAIVQAVTGLNCGFTFIGARVYFDENGNLVVDGEFDGFGFIVKEGEQIKLRMYKSDWSEVVEEGRDDRGNYIEVVRVAFFD